MKDKIIACFEELCGDFEDEHGRAPSAAEEADLWTRAEEMAMDRAIAHAENMNDQREDR